MEEDFNLLHVECLSFPLPLCLDLKPFIHCSKGTPLKPKVWLYSLIVVGWAVGDKMSGFQVILLTLNLALHRELEEGRLLIKIGVLPGEALHTAKVLLD